MSLLRSLGAWVFTLAVACGAHAQETYPSRPVTIVVPAAAGSLTDTSARILGARLAHRLNQPFVIDNRPGANGQIAMEWLIKQKADGYTLTLAPSTTHAGNPSLYRKLRYDPVSDFTPIARVGQTALVVAVNNALPVRSMKELISYAKSKPERLSYASANAGSRVGAEMIAAAANVQLVGVPYKVSGQALTDLIAGHVDMYVVDFLTGLPSVEAGKIRGLAVTTSRASPVFPGLPPVSDTLPGFEVVAWNALYGPAGMPKAVVDRLASTVNEVLAEPDTQAALLRNGVTPMPSQSPGELRAYTIQQIALWRMLVQQAGIEPE